jgi:hypothetical protein
VTVISIRRLQSVLLSLSLGEPDLVRLAPAIAPLLARQRRLDRLERLADWMETPSPETAALVVADQNERVGRDDSEPRPWFAGLRHLRRRLTSYGKLQSRQVEHLLVETPPDLPTALVQIILLVSTTEPGVVVGGLLAIARRLRAEITLN